MFLSESVSNKGEASVHVDVVPNNTKTMTEQGIGV